MSVNSGNNDFLESLRNSGCFEEEKEGSVASASPFISSVRNLDSVLAKCEPHGDALYAADSSPSENQNLVSVKSRKSPVSSAVSSTSSVISLSESNDAAIVAPVGQSNPMPPTLQEQVSEFLQGVTLESLASSLIHLLGPDKFSSDVHVTQKQLIYHTFLLDKLELRQTLKMMTTRLGGHGSINVGKKGCDYTVIRKKFRKMARRLLALTAEKLNNQLKKLDNELEFDMQELDNQLQEESKDVEDDVICKGKEKTELDPLTTIKKVLLYAIQDMMSLQKYDSLDYLRLKKELNKNLKEFQSRQSKVQGILETIGQQRQKRMEQNEQND